MAPNWKQPDVEAGPNVSGSSSPMPKPSPTLPPSSRFSPPLPKRWFSWLVPAMTLANVGMFIYSMYVNDCPSNKDDDSKCLGYPFLGRFSFQPLKENPLLGPSTLTLRKLGGLQVQLLIENGEWWRLLSCNWLHAGFIHLLANMVSLVLIGVKLEQEFGFWPIYLVSGFGGSLLSSLNILKKSSNSTISVGASGALFGLLGAMLSELLTNWTIYERKCFTLTILLAVIGLNMAFGFLPRVDNSAHVGGFVTGLLLGFIVMMRPQYGYVSRKHIPEGYNIIRKSKHKGYQYLLLVMSLFLLISGFSAGLAVLYRDS